MMELSSSKKLTTLCVDDVRLLKFPGLTDLGLSTDKVGVGTLCFDAKGSIADKLDDALKIVKFNDMGFSLKCWKMYGKESTRRR